MKEDGSISTFMYNNKGQLISETQYTNSKQKTKELYWVWVESMPLAQVEIPFANNVAGTHTINYLHTDHLNTPRWATNQSKQKVWSWNSDAYGNTLANENPLNTGKITTIPLRFPGQYFDSETRLHYNYFRTYDPDLGRYTQPDPIGLEGGWNMFTYVDGNPLRRSDALGLSTEDVIIIINKIQEAVNNMTNQGLRIPPTWPVNINNSIPGTLDCGGQTDFTITELDKLIKTLTDTWEFHMLSGFGHAWGVGVSSNPNDPIIWFDPRAGEYSTIKPCPSCHGSFGGIFDDYFSSKPPSKPNPMKPDWR